MLAILTDCRGFRPGLITFGGRGLPVTAAGRVSSRDARRTRPVFIPAAGGRVSRAVIIYAFPVRPVSRGLSARIVYPRKTAVVSRSLPRSPLHHHGTIRFRFRAFAAAFRRRPETFPCRTYIQAASNQIPMFPRLGNVISPHIRVVSAVIYAAKMVYIHRLESAARVPVYVITRLPHGKDSHAGKIVDVDSAIAVVAHVIVIARAERTP